MKNDQPNFQKQIEEFMQGTEPFTIFLKNRINTHFNAEAQSGGGRIEIGIIPKCDLINFKAGKNNAVQVEYIRVYSDFPPSTNSFSLENIEKVEITPIKEKA